MSVWQTTSYINAMEREVPVTVLMPDCSPDEPHRFETVLYAAPKGYESDYIVRRTMIEVTFCKRGSTAAVCIPSSVLENAKSEEAVKEIVALLGRLYPLKFVLSQDHPDIQFLQ